MMVPDREKQAIIAKNVDMDEDEGIISRFYFLGDLGYAPGRILQERT